MDRKLYFLKQQNDDLKKYKDDYIELLNDNIKQSNETMTNVLIAMLQGGKK